MKQWRTIVLAVATVLAVLFIVQISSNYIFDKNSSKREKESQPNPVRILSSRRSTSSVTSSPSSSPSPSPSHTIKNFSRKLQHLYRRNNSSRTGKTKGTHKHFCWENEDFKIAGECIRCSSYEKRVSTSCQETGNKQLVWCFISKKKSYKSCHHVRWIEERNFWSFEGTMCILLIFSSLSVWQRNKKLESIYQEKLRQKVSNDA